MAQVVGVGGKHPFIFSKAIETEISFYANRLFRYNTSYNLNIV